MIKANEILLILGLGELFTLICLVGSLKTKYPIFSMFLFNMFMTSVGIYVIPLSIIAIRSDSKFWIIFGGLGLIFGAISSFIGLGGILLFSDEYKDMFKNVEN